MSVESQTTILNIAAYKFVTLDQLENRRGELQDICERLELRGTILLSPEGINLFIAGETASVGELLGLLRQKPEFCDLEAKESVTTYQPFNRMLVRIKKEIIAFGVDGIDPREFTSPRVEATTLKQWLDEKRDVILLDVRNDYEIEVGTFKNAVPVNVDFFRDFPDAIQNLPSEWKDKPVVTFCTGGIRCEKAAPLMQREGFQNVYQLEGGILKYFEECGGEHYDGDCFVFDQRVAVDSQLQETDAAVCFACQAVLTVADQQSDAYIVGRQCPHCLPQRQSEMQDRIAEREAKLRELTTPLPGCQPYENRRPINVAGQYAGLTLIDFLTTAYPVQTREQWLAACTDNRIQLNKGEQQGRTQPVTVDRIVRAGERFDHVIPNTVEPAVSADIQILHEDEAIVVVNKPAPLPVHPCGRFNRNTLTELLNLVYAPIKMRPAHRLDAHTTGVTVLSRTKQMAADIQAQFGEGTVAKSYLALVVGSPFQDEFQCEAPISREPATGGVRIVDDENGLSALTEFRVLDRRAQRTLLAVVPVTGRTNQIRVHLWHLGLPIVGDPVYRPDGVLATTESAGNANAHVPLHLHASSLEFTHPITQRRVTFQSSAPDWAAQSDR